MNVSGSEGDRTRRFIELLATHERKLARYVLALVPNWADADDIMQQTKVRLWEQFDKYDPSQEFGAWACTVAYYQVLTHRKTTQRRHAYLSQHYLDAMSAEIERVNREPDRWQAALEVCLDQLHEASRRLLALCYGENRSIKEAAQMLGRSVGATQKAVYRVRQALQQCVERRLLTE